ncbi:MAG: cobalamin-binding protein [Bryobacteraceae bacterium]|nr:cobalamin-binding protein [Bryobacteraceae bacterium]
MKPILCLALACAGALLAAPPPARIVSTAPSVTEMLFALGLGDRVVGVSTFCNHPPSAQKLPKVGTFLRPDLETILALKPNLVILHNNPVPLAERLEKLGVRALELEHDSVAGIFESLHEIGAATGRSAEAAALASSLDRRLKTLRARTAKLPKRKIMFVVGRNPGTLDGILAVGKASYLNEVIEIAGGQNIFRDSIAPYPNVSLEEILARNPDVIVDMGDMAQTVGVTEEHKRIVVSLWARQKQLAAVRHKAVHAVAADIFVVPGPRVIEAAEAFARMLHPEGAF